MNRRYVRAVTPGDGIAKVFSTIRMQPDGRPSRDDFECIVVPEAERICSCMAIGAGGEPITERFEDGVDLVMSGEKLPRLPARHRRLGDFGEGRTGMSIRFGEGLQSSTHLLGVYLGRLLNESGEDVQVGRVWPVRLIDEIAMARVFDI